MKTETKIDTEKPSVIQQGCFEVDLSRPKQAASGRLLSLEKKGGMRDVREVLGNRKTA